MFLKRGRVFIAILALLGFVILAATGSNADAELTTTPAVSPNDKNDNDNPSPDFDGDGTVGISDFLLFVDVFGSSRSDGTYQAKYDLDGNGVIGIPDFLIFVDSFGKEVPSQTVRVSVCDRTGAVRDAIVALVPVSTCGDVTAAHLSAIDSLSLSDARLAELQTGDLSGLTGLTMLNLQENRLSSLPDDFFDDLTSLSQALSWECNRLTSIPSELFTPPNLTYLDLSNNRLGGEVPTALGNLSSLTFLSLSRNQLDGEIPTELSNLSNLTFLSLSGNRLDGEIPTELSNLSNLKELWLWGNQLEGEIPTELSNLSNLDYTGSLQQSVEWRDSQQNWAPCPISLTWTSVAISWWVRYQQCWAICLILLH